ncbi:class I fructose-bisphosphate aldolase [Candidatus Lariskella endosymbiont of Epinotia ramella]|uniref:class I fructose-bisphosphate aldolase n=1 Tax=Candidatus Lariskella endosymbiont of Epinotia ramella TaxID=3066224 RepID=UPI0030CFA4BC
MSALADRVLSNYTSDNPGTKANLARIMFSGKLAGSGKLVILPVDQGFEHGPAKSFAVNPAAYDPYYHVELAVAANLNAFAAPIGMMEIIASNYAHKIPLILKLNSSNLLTPKSLAPDQAYTASVHDALRLGCAAVGLTIYPGSANADKMMEDAAKVVANAKDYGLPTVIWSYPRGEDISKNSETAVDVVAYAAHIAALIGAHIIKVKLPAATLSSMDISSPYKDYGITIDSLNARVAHVMQCAFQGKRIVVFSGGVHKSLEDLYNDINAICSGGGHGSIIGRNTFQRPRNEALKMLSHITDLYTSAK